MLRDYPEFGYCYEGGADAFYDRFEKIYTKKVNDMLLSMPEEMTESEIKEFGKRLGDASAIEFGVKYLDKMLPSSNEKCIRIRRDAEFMAKTK